LDEIQKLEPHPHLIRAIFSCQVRDKYYTVFPWADGGSLKEFWKSPDSKANLSDKDLLRWSLQQLLGIADALKALHSTNYRHGDLKPDNILYFKGGNPFCQGSKDTLVIADFGTSKQHKTDTKMRVDGTNTRATTPAYEAPEVDGKQTAPRSRRYDMWSLGCILLEFAVWLLYGQDGIERFCDVRVHNCKTENPVASFYEPKEDEKEDEKEGEDEEEEDEEEEDEEGEDKEEKDDEGESNFQINSAVVEVMTSLLEEDPRCQGRTALGDLVALIPRYLLQPKAAKRATAEEWWKELQQLVETAEKDESYLIRPVDSLPDIPDAFVIKVKKSKRKPMRNHDV
jgi:serine/threonine protein kinase